MKSVDIIIPIYFEEKVILAFYKRLRDSVLPLLENYQFQFIYVNDGSTDDSLKILRELAKTDARIVVINLSRNFGHQNAISAGIDYSQGDAAVIIDGDLQDPPEVIPQIIREWESGFEVVYCQRLKRKAESYFKLASASLFYRMLNKVSDIYIPLDTGDFRIMDRKIINVLKNMREEGRFIRGLVAWMGFRQKPFFYERDARYAGVTKYSLKRMIDFAFSGFVSFSTLPLRFATQIGFLISFLSFVYIGSVVVEKISHPEALVRGWTTVVSIVSFFGGINLFFLGLLGEYVGHIFKEAKKRPLYVVDQIYKS